MAKKSLEKKLNWLLIPVLSLFLFGCGQTAQIQPAVSNSQNQAAPKKDIENKPEPDKKLQDKKLQAETDALLPLFDDMPSVPVYPTDEPVIKSGTNTERAVAYTRCENRRFPSIFVKKNFYQKVNRRQLVNILKHELTHAWLCRQEMPWGHDERFRRKFKQIGGFGN